MPQVWREIQPQGKRLMSILTVILAETKEEAELHVPSSKPGFSREKSIESYTLPSTTSCRECGSVHIDPSRIKIQWRISITDTK